MSSNPSIPAIGFRFASRSAGIKRSGKPDLALIVSDSPARCAGVFTTNKVIAAPLEVSAPRIKQGYCQAILINSGNANACTGEPGRSAARRCSELTAAALAIDEQLVAVASTGVIGVPLPMACFEEHIPLLPADLAADAVAAAGVAQAMMTTDAFPKVASAAGFAGGVPYTIFGVAKGAGMIHPNMATMLGFILTDALLSPELLRTALHAGVDVSFNSITVDRDTSTNDTVLLLANGAAGTPEIVAGSADAAAFCALLNGVLLDLAKMIVRDGEGATKLVTIRVKGGVDAAQARTAACSVATSSLVKTAFFGEDANWGRIIAAVGYSGAEVEPEKVDISFDAIAVVRNGLGTGKELEAQATAVLKKPEFMVTVDLHLGPGEAIYYTSDLTYDYVKINGAYRT
ncbi:MAG: bifunctional ornithine acetyltransferase/N-acetylglutamate synthase [Desulfuromonadales bacterium GWD2_61_12]|nr:MAG: bifunctional ornithine acetyltransferase/N-acetylglutamate synthase [Desulfuromonadales bacterium GWC2_61_20]OGR36435.1 MAG: bifunctional ornithine acetyltransferase/N-acetylglutamate synthase [Desulfuromonadales bacterium GWD2_61_12]HAD03537.1 ornithine acetyltransferase [Desulfuromonas sp.]HBT83156.1 ornithine acetyltransferase [Desulfuromonas sp.]